MRKIRIVLVVGLAICTSLGSCTQSVTTVGDSDFRKKVSLEDMGNGICHQLSSGLMWQIEESKKFSTWNEANEYANSLELGGFDDWRLPTRSECYILAELLVIKKGECPIKFKRGHWISNNKKRTSGYWEDYPLCGGSELRWLNEKRGSVRAVRP